MDKRGFPYDLSYTQNRELSWLKFNERVLEEAEDAEVPVFERLKFLSIFTSNLDEFFMIRVGSLFDLTLLKEPHRDHKCGLTPKEQLEEIFRSCVPLCRRRDKAYRAVEREMRNFDCANLTVKELEPPEKAFVKEYFRDFVAPVLSPQILDVSHPFPHLENKALTVAVSLAGEKKELFGLIPVPKSLPRVLFLPGSSLRYVLLERIISEYAGEVFESYTITEKTVISVTRNADINPDDEAFEVEEDYLHHMKKLLKKRSRLAPVRLEVKGSLDGRFISYLCGKLKIEKQQVFRSTAPLDMSYVFSLPGKMPPPLLRIVTYQPFVPQWPSRVSRNEPVSEQLLRGDILLSYPYESMEPFLRLVRESAADPRVLSLKITIYRLSHQSRLIEALTAAAENGKDVTVLMELRARFDEQNNIEWAQRLEEAGCRVIYGPDGFKVHSKVCLITRRDKGKIQYFTQIGTGNYNEKTAALYTDFSLMTANQEIGADAALFFKNMAIGNLDGEYRRMLVAPHSLKRGILQLIAGEEEKARSGGKGLIMAKMNSLTDREVIDALCRASQAGVEIRLLIRGICCLLPGVAGKTENITVTSVVGRFLEHSRIYCFGAGAEMKVYLSSADLMTRNTQRRVELACPVEDRDARGEVTGYLEIMLRDNKKARLLTASGEYSRMPPENGEMSDAQELLMKQAKEQNAQSGKQAENRKSAWIQTVWKQLLRRKR